MLGGWVATAKTWDSFSGEWPSVLAMKPRTAYFKWSEAWGLSGEFLGISEESRDEKVKTLVRVIRDHNPLAITSVMPNALYEETFGENPDKVIRHPYFFSFFAIVTILAEFIARQEQPQKVDFIFDVQHGQMDAVHSSWDRLIDTAPPKMAAIIENPPNFRHSVSTMPLQAADLCAGWTREQAEGEGEGEGGRAVAT